ncbi:hypothetical protein SCUCBS95973_009420 [Sporothrix curviconia]|uniref:Major facilitator superfamily (MFS) profile domain-containing protein n=1 Tax=Sporothrix curviconia TaxID=1260050 RepID=A0ABP0CUW3_9PEZI
MVSIPFTQEWLARNRVTGRLMFATLLVSITVFNFGFDTTAYSTIQAMDPFIDRFGQCNAQGKCSFTATHLSFLNSLPRITFGVGIVAGEMIGSRYGRRPVIVVYNVIAMIGSIVSYTSKNYAQILAGRMIVFLYIGMEGWLVPMFQAEIVPAHMRGAVVVSYVFNHIFGSFIMASVTYVTSQWETAACWKVPVALGIPLPAIVLLLSWVIPESPRWLLRQNRDEEALQSLRSMFGNGPNFAPEEEMALLKSSLAEEASRAGASWMDLFRGTNLRRTMIAIITAFLNQATGQNFISQYGTVFIKSLNTMNAFEFTLISSGIGCIGPVLTILTIDRIGRRGLYFTFGLLCSLSIFTVGALGLATPTSSVKIAIVSLTMIYGLFYAASFGPVGPVTSSEVPSLRLRDKSISLSWNVQNVSNFLVSFTLPYLLDAGYADLESKVGFIYGSIGLAGIVWGYFYFPELKGRSLEEIDEMFAERVPARKTRKWISSNPDSIGVRISKMENSEFPTTSKLQEADGSPGTNHVNSATA